MGIEKDVRISKIIAVLASNPEGLWLRSLSQKTKIPPGTLHRYLEKDLSDIVDNLGVKDDSGRHFGLRIVKLKPRILDILSEGGYDKLKKFLDISKNL